MKTETKYTYSEELFSDFHKDAFGFRPRNHRFYDADTTPAEKQEIWDYTGRVMEQAIADEKAREEEDLKSFEEEIESVISYGAGDRTTALRWMTQDETFYHSQDVESWVWNKGILFTDYGRKLVKELMDIVTFAEWSTE